MLAVAVLIGVAVPVGSALFGHEILVLMYGEDLSVIDDTIPMITAVWGSYLVGIVAGLVALVAGWRRSVRWPESTGQSPRSRAGSTTAALSTPDHEPLPGPCSVSRIHASSHDAASATIGE